MGACSKITIVVILSCKLGFCGKLNLVELLLCVFLVVEVTNDFALLKYST